MSSRFIIEKGIPIPEKKMTGVIARVDLTKMDIGDSFLTNNKNIKSARSNWSRAGRLAGVKMTVRETADGIRVWRIA